MFTFNVTAAALLPGVTCGVLSEQVGRGPDAVAPAAGATLHESETGLLNVFPAGVTVRLYVAVLPAVTFCVEPAAVRLKF